MFSGGLHEVSIGAIDLIDMAEKPRHGKAGKSRPNKTENRNPTNGIKIGQNR